jgi:hypothetical protein
VITLGDHVAFDLFRRFRGGEFLEARIIPQRIEHGIEPEQSGSERHAFSQRAIDGIQCVLATDCYRK